MMNWISDNEHKIINVAFTKANVYENPEIRKRFTCKSWGDNIRAGVTLLEENGYKMLGFSKCVKQHFEPADDEKNTQELVKSAQFVIKKYGEKIDNLEKNLEKYESSITYLLRLLEECDVNESVKKDQ